MVARDEARLDKLYQQCLLMETDLMLEDERLKKLSEGVLLKVRKENQEIRALRESRRSELLECASSILEWVRDFAESPKGRKILSTLGHVRIFRDHYCECRPKEDKEYEAWLTCDRNGVLRYQEFYMGRMGRRRSKALTSPVQMVNRLHPNYVLSARDAITTGKVWKEVECAIRWIAEIFDIRRQCGWWPPQVSGQELVSS